MLRNMVMTPRILLRSHGNTARILPNQYKENPSTTYHRILRENEAVGDAFFMGNFIKST
jgi:hypothetical protein